MKKCILFGLIISILLVTGCNNSGKTLNCTLKEEAGGATTTSNMKVKFNGLEAESIIMDIEISYTDQYKSFADAFKQTLESQKSSLEETGYKVEITSQNNSVKLTAKGTSKTLKKEESTGTYKDTKESLEKSGYICK